MIELIKEDFLAKGSHRNIYKYKDERDRCLKVVMPEGQKVLKQQNNHWYKKVRPTSWYNENKKINEPGLLMRKVFQNLAYTLIILYLVTPIFWYFEINLFFSSFINLFFALVFLEFYFSLDCGLPSDENVMDEEENKKEQIKIIDENLRKLLKLLIVEKLENSNKMLISKNNIIDEDNNYKTYNQQYSTIYPKKMIESEFVLFSGDYSISWIYENANAEAILKDNNIIVYNDLFKNFKDISR